MKKLSLYVFLVVMFCNIGFAKDLFETFDKKDNISLFGIILGDKIDNYEHKDCFKPLMPDSVGNEGKKEYGWYECSIVPTVKNKTFIKHEVGIYPASKEIFQIRSTTKNFSNIQECRDNLKPIAQLVAENKEKQGLKLIRWEGGLGYFIDEDKNNFKVDAVGPGKKANKKLDIGTGCNTKNYSLTLYLGSVSFDRIDEESGKLKKKEIDKEGL